MRAAILVMACLGLAALSLAVVPAAPAYDPLMWLLWGRELAGGTLDTANGPAFKPLPVAVCALLAPLGSAAPTLWLLLARAGAVLAVALAAVLARRLVAEWSASASRAPLLAGAAAGLGVALTGSLLPLAAGGALEATFVAGALGGVLSWRADRPALSFACAVCCALIRVEAVPFLLVPALQLWRARPEWRPALAAAGVTLPALWLAPDALSTGELLRSAERARVPNPGQPALAEVPALASLGAAAGLALVPVCLGALALRPRRDRAAALLAVAGLAWLLLVAGMAQLGFSGEERYALPGVAAVTVAGAVGLARLGSPRGGLAAFGPYASVLGQTPPRPARRLVLAAVAALVLAAAAPRLAALPGEGEELAYAARLSSDLDRAVALAGGAESLLACGRPVVGQYRGPLLAYRLGVTKRQVIFEPGTTGVAFESRLSREHTPAPVVPARYRAVVRAGSWRVVTRCARPVARLSGVSPG